MKIKQSLIEKGFIVPVNAKKFNQLMLALEEQTSYTWLDGNKPTDFDLRREFELTTDNYNFSDYISYIEVMGGDIAHYDEDTFEEAIAFEDIWED